MHAKAAIGLAVLAGLVGGTGCAGEGGGEEPRYEVFVLGVAQDGGMPHLGCTKPCCIEARRRGREEFPASLGIHDGATGALALVEATPAIEKQIALLHRLTGAERDGRHPVDAVLLTHAHIGHYAGLVQFGREVASTDAIPVYGTPRMTGFLRSNGPWDQLVRLEQIRLVPVEPRGPFEPIPGIRVTPIPVPHRDEYSDTVAFRIEGPHRTVLFLPDTDRFGDGVLEALLDGVDVAYLDGTFYDGSELPGRDLSEIPHPLMTDTLERLATAAAKRPGRVRFLHLNHTNPALSDRKLRDEIRARGFLVAETGERVPL